MMKARYKEVAQIGIYSKTGSYIEFKQGETKEISNEVAAELKYDSRFEVIDPAVLGNEAPEAKGKAKVAKPKAK